MKESTNRRAHLGILLYCNWESEIGHWRVEYDAEFAIMCMGEEQMCMNVRFYKYINENLQVATKTQKTI